MMAQRKKKCNFDVEITADICDIFYKKTCDEIVLISGDSDFNYLVEKSRTTHQKMTIVSYDALLSKELRYSDARVIILDELPLCHYTFH